MGLRNQGSARMHVMAGGQLKQCDKSMPQRNFVLQTWYAMHAVQPATGLSKTLRIPCLANAAFLSCIIVGRKPS